MKPPEPESSALSQTTLALKHTSATTNQFSISMADTGYNFYKDSDAEEVLMHMCVSGREVIMHAKGNISVALMNVHKLINPSLQMSGLATVVFTIFATTQAKQHSNHNHSLVN